MKPKRKPQGKEKRVRGLATMLLQRLEICVELLKLAIEFVMVVAEAVGVVIHQNDGAPALTGSRSLGTPVPFVGFLP